MWKFRKIKLVNFCYNCMSEDLSTTLNCCHHAMEMKWSNLAIKKARGLIDTVYAWCSRWLHKVNSSFVSTELLNMRFRQNAMGKRSLILLRLINHTTSLIAALFWSLPPVSLFTHNSFLSQAHGTNHVGIFDHTEQRPLGPGRVLY